MERKDNKHATVIEQRTKPTYIDTNTQEKEYTNYSGWSVRDTYFDISTPLSANTSYIGRFRSSFLNKGSYGEERVTFKQFVDMCVGTNE